MGSFGSFCKLDTHDQAIHIQPLLLRVMPHNQRWVLDRSKVFCGFDRVHRMVCTADWYVGCLCRSGEWDRMRPFWGACRGRRSLRLHRLRRHWQGSQAQNRACKVSLLVILSCPFLCAWWRLIFLLAILIPYFYDMPIRLLLSLVNLLMICRCLSFPE